LISLDGTYIVERGKTLFSEHGHVSWAKIGHVNSEVTEGMNRNSIELEADKNMLRRRNTEK
jgi:hypothetical protein